MPKTALSIKLTENEAFILRTLLLCGYGRNRLRAEGAEDASFCPQKAHRSNKRDTPMSQSAFNAKRELGYALASLKYWQRELTFRKKARRPRAETIAQAERRVTTAIHRVCFWRGALRAQVRRREQHLAHWRAFVVPTEFERAAS
jgi:hypothetical protein